MPGRHRALVLIAAVAFFTGGCATYSDRMQTAMQSADGGSYDASLSALNKALGVDSEDELPVSWGKNDPLVVLERGVLLQSLGRYDASIRNLSAAEQEIELLDLTVDAVGTLSKYLYSDSGRKYRAPPSERLALNAVNLLNYLARGDLDGAAVEARRFQVQREFLTAQGIAADGPASLGAYLSGVVFEKLGEGDRALRYYEEALAASGRLASLREPVARLASNNPYRGPQLEQLLAESGRQPSTDRSPKGEILIVTSVGRVPYRVPERMPIGAAIGVAGSIITDDLRVLERSAFKVLVIPGLKPVGSGLSSVAVRVNGQEAPLELITDLGRAVQAEYEKSKPAIIAAGVTRMLARAAISEGMRAAGNQGDNVLGSVAALVTEAALVAADRPDTRSWSLLPGRILATRVPVEPGEHVVEVAFGAGNAAPREFRVNVAPGGLATVVVTEPR